VTTHESNAATSRRAARRGDEQDAGVVTMLQELAPQLDVEPDPEYRRAARQRLVAMAAVRTPETVRPTALRRLLAARAVDAPAGRWRTRATAGLAGAALTVTSLATLVALSAGAAPGDVLYGVKRGTEQTQLALAGDSRGQALLALARTRLEELDDLDGDAGLVRSTLATMDDQTAEGASWYLGRAVDTSDPAPLDRVSRWAGEQSAQLDAVRAGVPPEATDAAAASLDLLDAITQRADGLRTALDCTEGPALAGSDQLGPVPGECPAAVGTPETPPNSAVPSEPAPGATAPQAGAPASTPIEPTPPADPPAQQPIPVPGQPQAPELPESSTATAPYAELDLPGGPPSLPVPTVPQRTGSPASPTTGSSSSEPVPKAPNDLLPCVALPPLLQAGDC
jgi:hypothetical protein